jgi:hypothetical protein
MKISHYEVIVWKGGSVRDVITAYSKSAAIERRDEMAKRWTNCDMIFVRRHETDPTNHPHGTKFVTLHKLTLDFRRPK